MSRSVEEKEKQSGALYFVYEGGREELPEALLQEIEAQKLEWLDAGEFFENSFESKDRIIAHGSLLFLKKVLRKAESESFGLAILPTPKQPKLARLLGLSGVEGSLLAFLGSVEPQPLDLLYAEEEPVFFSALVGEAPPLGLQNMALNEDLERGSRLGLFFRAFWSLRGLRRVLAEVTTAKGQTLKTAITGALIFNREANSFAANLLQESSYNDGQLRALLISPLSVVSYLHHLTVSIYARFRQSTLPDSVGLIKSESLRIECDPPLKISVDGVERGETPMSFRVHPKAIRFCASESFWERNHPTQSDKETLRVDHLPKEDEAKEVIRKHLPILTHASEEEYKELFTTLRADGKLSSTFVILMILSTLLATVGLFLNSASVVIGAMLLAPLMQPIVTFSMGLLRWDGSLAYGALRTVSVGVVLVLLSALILAALLPFRELTAEMAGRLHPSLLDLLVAVVSGIAAAYAKNNPKISGSLVGVAIAVALVPPLSTAGIGLGWGEWTMFYHAFLLFLTNFAGIVFAAALMFMLLGFSPLHRAQKGLIYGVMMVLIVAIPLTLTFRQMVRDADLLQRLERQEFRVEGTRVALNNMLLHHDKIDRLLCDLLVSRPLTTSALKRLKDRIERIAGEPLEMECSQRIRF